jgi:hypothetical protein
MINIGNEQLVPLNDVPRLLPARGNGKRIHISAVYRWAQRGVRGARLEVIRVGGTTYTSREALQRFSSNPIDQTVSLQPTSAARKKQIDRALSKVDEFLYAGKRDCKSGHIAQAPNPQQTHGRIIDGATERAAPTS